MKKRMLINASQMEELRVALVDGTRLYDLDIESGAREQKKSNIYKARVEKIEPSLEAAFINFGSEKHGFLPFREISPEYFNSVSNSHTGRISIQDVLKEGQELIVQVSREERGNKGAMVTTFVNLASRYLVLMPNNPQAGGISRSVGGEERNQLRSIIAQLSTTSDMGLIVRTAGIGRSVEELQWDLDYLVQLWYTIKDVAEKRTAPFLIHQESNMTIRAIRDYLRSDIDEVLIDNVEAYNEAINFVQQVMPQYANKVKHYQGEMSLFNHFRIESQIETAFQRVVELPSGGSIVIDHTEALIAIDVNSARATRGGNINETAVQTNLEAVEEITRQLRLRDIGGLVVIDFIDMVSPQNQRAVEDLIHEHLRADRSRVLVGRISRFGLLELSRERRKASLGETSSVPCPRCKGRGIIRDVESLSLAILRLLEEEAIKRGTAEVRALTPISVAAFLLNEKRELLSKIEEKTKARILIVPSSNLETPDFEVQRLRDDSFYARTNKKASYEIQELEVEEEQVISTRDLVREEAAIKLLPKVNNHIDGNNVKKSVQKTSLLSKIKQMFSSMFGNNSEVIVDKSAKKAIKPRNPRNSKRNVKSEVSDVVETVKKPRSNNRRRKSNLADINAENTNKETNSKDKLTEESKTEEKITKLQRRPRGMRRNVERVKKVDTEINNENIDAETNLEANLTINTNYDLVQEVKSITNNEINLPYDNKELIRLDDNISQSDLLVSNLVQNSIETETVVKVVVNEQEVNTNENINEQQTTNVRASNDPREVRRRQNTSDFSTNS